MFFALTIASELIGIVILLLVIYFLGRPIIRGAIYFPTSPRSVEIMLRLADVKAGDKLVDLGSGDGRILIAAAKAGAEAVGYEINPVLVRRSRRAIARAGVDAIDDAGKPGNAIVHWEDFWRVDFSPFDVVIVYGIPYIMKDLQNKLERELRPGTKIISNAFTFPGWEPMAQERKIMLYIKK
jgi:cyclopropane fatty-acyl-phospholipid synthase-like methyltransferase